MSPVIRATLFFLLTAAVAAAACGPSEPPVDRTKIGEEVSGLADAYVRSYLDAFPYQALVIGAREVQPTRGEGAVMFFPDGASTGGRVQLQAKRVAWNIDVAWLTGQVKLTRTEADR